MCFSFHAIVGRQVDSADFSYSVTQAGRGFISTCASKKCGTCLKLPLGSATGTRLHLLQRGQGNGILQCDGHFTTKSLM